MNRTINGVKFQNIQIYALFALRIAIGWHFLYEGVTKLMMMPNWTSADYLQSTSWWFAQFFNKIGHKQSLGKGHQEQTFGSTVRRPLSSQTSRALTFA